MAYNLLYTQNGCRYRLKKPQCFTEISFKCCCSIFDKCIRYIECICAWACACKHNLSIIHFIFYRINSHSNEFSYLWTILKKRHFHFEAPSRSAYLFGFFFCNAKSVLFPTVLHWLGLNVICKCWKSTHESTWLFQKGI